MSKFHPEICLWDSQWLNIVNHDHCWEDWAVEDAVNKAVRLTEKAMRENCKPELHRLSAELEKVKAQVQRRDLLLQSLTPGGSEYVNAPERCAAYAQKVKRDQHEHIVQVTKRAKEAEAERDALRERIDGAPIVPVHRDSFFGGWLATVPKEIAMNNRAVRVLTDKAIDAARGIVHGGEADTINPDN